MASPSLRGKRALKRQSKLPVKAFCQVGKLAGDWVLRVKRLHCCLMGMTV